MKNCNEQIDRLIKFALQEDIGNGDHSSLACIVPGTLSQAKLVAKEKGIVCGVEIGKKVFHTVDPTLQVESMLKDGQPIEKGMPILTVKGNAVSILTAERTVLNFMQRMSGIATHTHSLVKLLDGLHTQLLDTRKTTPGLRCLEKYAVLTGGAKNHRFGLYDMIMLKDNHIDYAGGITQAIDRTHQYLQKHHLHLEIEIEVRNFQELDEVLRTGRVNRIMLDNFTPDDLMVAIKKVNKQFETEASGGITGETLRQYAETGVDYISVGALTHQVKSLDLSLLAE